MRKIILAIFCYYVFIKIIYIMAWIVIQLTDQALITIDKQTFLESVAYE